MALTDNPQRLRRVIVNGRPFEVETVWLHQRQVIFKLRGIDSISDAERLVGADVCIPLEERPAPAEGEYYQTDLIGCEVVDGQGTRLGTVEAWQEYGGPSLLEIRTTDGREVLIPFAKSICKAIDLSAKRIVVDLPEGLLDLEA